MFLGDLSTAFSALSHVVVTGNENSFISIFDLKTSLPSLRRLECLGAFRIDCWAPFLIREFSYAHFVEHSPALEWLDVHMYVLRKSKHGAWDCPLEEQGKRVEWPADSATLRIVYRDNANGRYNLQPWRLIQGNVHVMVDQAEIDTARKEMEKEWFQSPYEDAE